jgi:L-threonylcarbamoyladenylate synthase
MKVWAQAVYRQGGVFAYPTESVYGLGCDPRNWQAVMRLLALKKRTLSKGLIVVAANWGQLQPWMAALDQVFIARLKRSTSHPTTWLVPAAADAPRWLTGEYATIAMRVTQFAPLVRLCEQCGPMISTSANPAGRAPAKTALSVLRYFPGAQLDLVLGGKVGNAERPSQIIELLTGKVWRS